MYLLLHHKPRQNFSELKQQLFHFHNPVGWPSGCNFWLPCLQSLVASFTCLPAGAGSALGCFCCPPQGFTSSGKLHWASELGDLRIPGGESGSCKVFCRLDSGTGIMLLLAHSFGPSQSRGQPRPDSGGWRDRLCLFVEGIATSHCKKVCGHGKVWLTGGHYHNAFPQLTFPTGWHSVCWPSYHAHNFLLRKWIIHMGSCFVLCNSPPGFKSDWGLVLVLVRIRANFKWEKTPYGWT